ncbi:c-type cytochrome [Pontivivens insulae]|uniref:Cytochrome c-551 n=1 Tax=Pontivivens insulae TaxID=1639689 RepID=A0A2R8AF47_9RHOB|nr:cytochrome C [Pontivivens insulae]RED12086.1 cytochrome c [Pontivivens insulae]SPF30842.1 Cytochrome c-551 [Pontivivens insulae]
MSRNLVIALSALGLAATTAPVIAQDASTFRQCQSCHVVTSPDGTNIAGRGRTGPNLYGIIGQQAGTVDGFNYGPSLVAAGEQGLVWTEENLAAYIEDPTGFLREFTGDSSARSRMSYRARSGQAEVAAFLASAG